MLASADQHIFTVSEFNREVRLLMEQHFGFIWLEGEISNFSRPASGHWYLTLKDSQSQIRCAMFKGRNRLLKFEPQNGDQVLVRGAPGLYEARGDFQLILDRMEPVGEGLLQRQFEQTKKKLLDEGLFDESQKRETPQYPRTIGVITSPTGAAVRDVLHVLQRRFPAASVIIYPTAVQGESSVCQLAKAIAKADMRNECEVILLVRGGGSLEDLWSFNEEIVARAIHACRIPLVCGVGHETDFTIADLVADLRAPTPSAAAELVTPDIVEEKLHLDQLRSALNEAMSAQLEGDQHEIKRLTQRLLTQHPQRQLQEKSQRVDEFEQRLLNSITTVLSQKQSGLQIRSQGLFAASPQKSINVLKELLSRYHFELTSHLQQKVQDSNHRLRLAMRALNGVNPLATLERGYAVLRTKELKTVESIHGVQSGDKLTAIVSDGKIACRVENVDSDPVTSDFRSDLQESQ